MALVNTWDQIIAAGGTGVAISYHRKHPRDPLPARWVVWRLVNGKEVATNPDAAWYDYRSMAFSCHGREDKERARLEAIAWAEAKYGKQDFVRNRMGDLVPRRINEQFPIPKRERIP